MTEETEPPESAAGFADLLQQAVGAAFSAITAELQAQRRNQFGMSMSGLGRCRRQGAYRYAGTVPSDPELATTGERRAANMGTAIHRMLLPALAKVLGDTASSEVPVELNDGGWGLDGTLDLWWERARIVVDLKTVGERKLERALVEGPSDEYRKQVGGYALAKDADWIAWVYLDRSTGATMVDVEEFDVDYRREVHERIWELQRLAEDPDVAPRDERGPGLSYQCDGCPWLRRCWGRTAVVGKAGAQSHIAQDDPAVEWALAQYDEHRSAESRHKKAKEFWRHVATGGGRTEGVYGRFKFWFGKPGNDLDGKAIEEEYAARGESVPVKKRAGALNVKAVK